MTVCFGMKTRKKLFRMTDNAVVYGSSFITALTEGKNAKDRGNPYE